MKKILKVIAGILLSLVLLALAAIVALMVFIHPNDYKPQLQQLAAKQNVQLIIEGDLGWSFYPQLGIRAGKFSVKPPMENVSKPFQFDELTVSVQLLPLLHRQIIINSIVIRASEITLQDKDDSSKGNLSKNNVTTIKNLLIESQDVNLDQRGFPLAISLQASTTQPARDLRFKATMQASLDHDIQQILLNDFTMQLDDTQFKGNIQATLGSKSFFKVKLAGTKLDIDHYFPVTPDEKHKGESDHNNSKDTSQDENDALIPAASLQALPGDYYFSLQDLTLQHLHVNDVVVDVQISQEGMATIKTLKAGVYGGEFAMHGTVDARSALPAVALKISLQNLNLQPALKDYLQVEKTLASGDFSFDSNVTTHGLTKDQLMAAMNGNFSFASQKITLDHFDITSSLNTSLLQLLQVKLPALMSGEDQTVFSNVIGKGDIEQGVINNRSFTATGPCMQFNGAGSYNLLDAGVLYQLGITFPSSDTAKACAEINGKLKDIVWPVVCKGSLNDGAAKICGADQSAIQKIVAKNAGEKLEKKLDDKLHKKFGKDADAIKNTLKGLF